MINSKNAPPKELCYILHAHDSLMPKENEYSDSHVTVTVLMVARDHMVTRVEAYDVMKSRKKSRDIANFVEFASDVPLSVDGTVLDPLPALNTQKSIKNGLLSSGPDTRSNKK